MSARGAAAIAAGLLAVFLALGLRCAAHLSQTYDECVHIGSGYSYLATRDFRMARSHPPLSLELEALPIWLLDRPAFQPVPGLWARIDDWSEYTISRDWMYGPQRKADRWLFLARLPMLALGLLTVALTGWWGFRLWGARAGLVAASLAALDPTLLAHSSLANNDAAAAALVLATCYAAWELLRAPSWGRVAATGACTGLALCTKFSCVAELPVLALALASRPLPLRGLETAPRPLQTAAATAAIGAGAALVFPVVYLGHALQGAQIWLEGFLDVMQHLSSGHVCFLMGRLSATGWWYYFPVAFALKSPLGTLAALAIAGLFWRRAAPLTLADSILLLAPPGLFWAAALTSRLDIGLRHLLPAFPFMFLLAGRVATVRFSRPALAVAVLGLPLSVLAFSSLASSPDQLSYFNEAVGGGAQGYRYLTDSNVDWGQDLRELAELTRANGVKFPYLCYFGTAPPRYYGLQWRGLPGSSALRSHEDAPLPSWPKPDLLAISAFKLQGVHPPSIRGMYSWLLKRRPAARVGDSIFVYDLTHDAEAHARLAEAYSEFGLRNRAAEELAHARELGYGR